MSNRPPGLRLPINEKQFSELLLVLHRSAVDTAEVRHFLAACAQHIDAISGAVSICEVSSGKWRYIDYFPETNANAEDYEARYAAEDPVRAAVARAEPRRFYLRSELLTPQVIATHPYFTEWYARLGYEDVCVARFPVGEAYNCHFGFIRGTDQPPFTRREQDFLDLLLPHVEHSVLLHTRIDRLTLFADIAQEHLLQSGQGLIVLNVEGHAVFMNRIAQRLQREAPVFGVENGKLVLPGPDSARFAELVGRCVAVSRRQGIMTSGTLTVLRPGSSPFAISVMPYRQQDESRTSVASDGRAIVVLFDPDRPVPDSRAQLREMYGLSAAEADVCWRIGNGGTVEDMATALGVTRETVRSQLKRVFHKTGTKRQSDLVRLVLLGPAAWNRMF